MSIDFNAFKMMVNAFQNINGCDLIWSVSKNATRGVFVFNKHVTISNSVCSGFTNFHKSNFKIIVIVRKIYLNMTVHYISYDWLASTRI